MNRSAKLGIALCSTAAVVLVAVVDTQRVSPGPLATVHGREDDLSGDGDCSSCHGGWFSNMTDSCAECHELITQQIETRDGLHGALSRTQAVQCAACHSEHHGPNFSIVNKQSFALAGAESIETFDHRLVGFEMDGKHLSIDCNECHEHAFDSVLAKGELRYGGLDPTCTACHVDVHEGQFVLSCTACHGQNSWDELHSEGHEKHLPLIGGHGDVECRKCHEEETPHALEILGGKKGRPQNRECTVCHESPHAARFLDGIADQVAMTPGASCVTCHLPEHEVFREEHVTTTPAQHAASGFSLAEPHDKPACADCHDPEGRDFKARYPGRGAYECSACHEDPHGGQFEEGPFSTGDCVACHDTQHFEPHAFSVEKHQLADFALSGAHLTTECDQCHTDPPKDEPRQFRGTAGLCEDCHDDAHQGFFERVEKQLPRVHDGMCARCHATETFADVPADRFDHGKWTGFPVLGAHSQAGCESCHQPREAEDERGRKFGRVEEHFGKYQGCVTCHEDPHRGMFDGPEHPRVVSGRKDCARCHVESSFRTFPHGFDHALWSGFTLIGPHAEIDCAACHTPLRTPDEDGRTWARAKGPECIDCHIDPHARQFEVRGVTDCKRCHVDDVANYLDFDHEHASRFPLRPQHTEVECDACHVPEPVDGKKVVRYRPMGRECGDCHDVDEDVLIRKRSRRK